MSGNLASTAATELSLDAASKSDIPTFIQIHAAAFAKDNAVRLMFKSTSEYTEKLHGMLTSQVADPNYSVIKAVRKSTDEVLGWLGFEWIGYPSSDGQYDGKEVQIPVNPLAASDAEPKGGERTLRSVMHADFRRVQDEWMKGKRYIHIGTVVVHPSHQGKGVGSALVRFATSKADSNQDPCWIQSSPAAHGVYYHCGFRDVGRLEVDLREFADGGSEGKEGWGIFEFVYMLRLPENRTA
ncbi:hypothetical protein P7C71_g96, partial [Lecanoromycetidae sp. Uapishka_2]